MIDDNDVSDAEFTAEKSAGPLVDVLGISGTVCGCIGWNASHGALDGPAIELHDIIDGCIGPDTDAIMLCVAGWIDGSGMHEYRRCGTTETTTVSVWNSIRHNAHSLPTFYFTFV